MVLNLRRKIKNLSRIELLRLLRSLKSEEMKSDEMKVKEMKKKAKKWKPRKCNTFFLKEKLRSI